MGRVSVESLWPTVDTLVQGEGSKEFIKSSRVGSKAFLAQKCSNSHGMFLPLVEYKECGWRGFIAIPEGREDREWRSCAAELQKVATFLKLSFEDGRLQSRKILDGP